jgi:hypothetical protein
MSKRATYLPWTPAELVTLVEACREGLLIPEIQRRHFPHRTLDSIRHQMHKQQCGIRHLAARGVIPMVRPVAEYRAPDGPTLAEVYAPEESADEDEGAFLERVRKSARQSIDKARGQRHATLRIASRAPIAVSLSSDWHVAPKGTDIDGLLEYAAFVADTPGLYALAVGDLLDNPIKHKGSNVAQIADDLRLLDIIVGKFRGKILGTTSGNHDDWSKVLAGTDHLQTLARRHRIHYAPDELLWVVEIVDPDDAEHVTARYRIHTRHQWRRHSNLNPLHACWTWLQEEGVNWEAIPDVLAIGHNHVAAHGCHQYEQRDIWGLRMGAWQVDSAYARAKGFARYRATAPTVVLPAAQGRVVCFSDPEDAVQFMNGERVAA